MVQGPGAGGDGAERIATEAALDSRPMAYEERGATSTAGPEVSELGVGAFQKPGGSETTGRW